MVVRQALGLRVPILLRVCIGCKFMDGICRTTDKLSGLKGTAEGKGSVCIPSLLSSGATGMDEQGDKAVGEIIAEKDELQCSLLALQAVERSVGRIKCSVHGRQFRNLSFLFAFSFKQCFLKDFRSTIELFAKKGDEKSLDSFIPKSESDFLEYAELISHKLRSFEVYLPCYDANFCFFDFQQFLTWSKNIHSLMQKSYNYIGLLKAIMRLSMTAKRAADAKEVSASVTAIANEKIKLRKKPTLAKRSKNVDEYNTLFFIHSLHLGRKNSFMLIRPKMIWWLMLLMTMILCNLFRFAILVDLCVRFATEVAGVQVDINEEWILDKTQFCYDGLKRQRLNDPMIRGRDGRFKVVSWHDALAGKLSDAMMALKDFVNKMGSNNVWCEGNGPSPNADLRSGYIMNCGINGLESADVFLLVVVLTFSVIYRMELLSAVLCV
ncbi:hypothetical protein DKX38_027403 [Salix brachista]|uniref:Molybdopterin oxidoreductase domain-containing protein n=1 Tax=Salix brachista TaxID=2182728 RepID=A0A5N5JH69_9ROSI|nr:hypothetical protein DKX38_027403 [Salix brachista]